MNKRFRPLLIVAGTAVVLVAGCSDRTSAPGTQADHGTEATSADHSTMDHGMMAQDATEAAAASADGAKPYPLAICLVSGEKLGEMGEPQRLVYQGQEMKFCCEDCVKDFQADPDQYISNLTTALAKPMDMPADGGDHSQH